MDSVIDAGGQNWFGQTQLSACGVAPWVPLRPATIRFGTHDLPEYVAAMSHPEPLAVFASEFGSGNYIRKSGYSHTPTGYAYLSVADFSSKRAIDGATEEQGLTYLKAEVGGKHAAKRLQPHDLVVTRSGTVGVWQEFHGIPDVAAIPSHHLTYVRVTSDDVRIVLKYYLTSPFCRGYSEAFSTGKNQKEISSWAVKRIPVPGDLDYATLAAMIRSVEPKIREHLAACENLQVIIDDELQKAGIKTKPFCARGEEHCTVEYSELGSSVRLRLGARFHTISKVHEWNLIDEDALGLDMAVDSLGRVIAQVKPGTVDGVLPKPMILIELENIGVGTGLTEAEPLVTEVGSSKVVFGDAELVTSKMRPYLGYTILNDPQMPLVGSSELLCFKRTGTYDVPVEFVQYLLLSKEYLYKSAMLVAGKTHPRIYPDEMLSFRVPVPSRHAADCFVKAVQARRDATREHRAAAFGYVAQIHSALNQAIVGDLEISSSVAPTEEAVEVVELVD